MYQSQKIRVQVWAVVLLFFAVASSCSEIPNGCPVPVPKSFLRNRLYKGLNDNYIYFHGRNARTVRVSIRLFQYPQSEQTVFYHIPGNSVFYCLFLMYIGV